MRFNLSEVSELIRERRTIYPRQFSQRKIHKDMLETMLENARWAPTHKHTQPWHYVVFREEGRKKLAEFQADLYEKITPVDKFRKKKYEKLLERPARASVVIAICMKRDEKERIPEVEEISATAASVQNILLTATAYGLGAFWSTGGVTFRDEMKDFLRLKDKDRCLGFIYLGYPEVKWPKGQRKPMEYYTEWVEE